MLALPNNLIWRQSPGDRLSRLLQFEQQFTNFDASVWGPIDSMKGAILGSGSESPSTSSRSADSAPVAGDSMSGIRRLGSGISSAGSQFWSSASEKGGLFDGIRDQASRLGSGASAGGAQLLESAAGRISQVHPSPCHNRDECAL